MGAQLLAVITPGPMGIFWNLRQRWKDIDLFLTSIKVSFVAPLTVRIPTKRGKWEKFRKVPGKALFSNGHKAIHCKAMLIALFEHISIQYTQTRLWRSAALVGLRLLHCTAQFS